MPGLVLRFYPKRRVSGDFLPKQNWKREPSFLLCVSFECDSLSEELEEEEETEYSGRGFYFSCASQVMALVLLGTSVYGIGLGLAMFQVIYNIQHRKVKYRARRGANDGLLTDEIAH